MITYAIECLPEDEPVRGNAMASGDEYDRKVEDEIIERLESGDQWAWCTVRVVASAGGVEGKSQMGCCSYLCADDFRNNSGYYDDMKREALDDLKAKIQSALAELVEQW